MVWFCWKGLPFLFLRNGILPLKTYFFISKKSHIRITALTNEFEEGGTIQSPTGARSENCPTPPPPEAKELKLETEVGEGWGVCVH